MESTARRLDDAPVCQRAGYIIYWYIIYILVYIYIYISYIFVIYTHIYEKHRPANQTQLAGEMEKKRDGNERK